MRHEQPSRATLRDVMRTVACSRLRNLNEVPLEIAVDDPPERRPLFQSRSEHTRLHSLPCAGNLDESTAGNAGTGKPGGDTRHSFIADRTNFDSPVCDRVHDGRDARPEEVHVFERLA